MRPSSAGSRNDTLMGLANLRYDRRAFVATWNMKLSRGLLLIRCGGYAITLGVLLGWTADQRLGSPLAEVAETLGLFLLASGTLALLAGCVVLCIKEQAKRLLFTGAVASGIFLLLIPGLASLAHFDANVHDWTGLLFFLWVLSCLVGPAILLVGLARFLFRQRHGQQP